MKVGGFFVSRAFPCGTARREGGVRRGGTRCARILVITLNSTAPLPKRETALFVALIRMYRVPGPYSTVPLRVSDCLLRSRRSPLRLSFLSEVGFLKHCPLSSAVCVGAFAVRALFQWWSASWWNALHSGVAVAEERSYPIRHRRHCTCHNCKPRHSGRTCIGFWAITSSVGKSPVRGGEPLYASIVLRILISKLSDISLILVFLSQR